MSAIAGMIEWRGAPAGPAVRKMIGALALHGRDGEGMWDGGDVALGWRQTVLHAEDRADRQPLTGGGGRFKLVFDGRIDNRDELARVLALSPERARDWPDSAYVLSAFERWGEDCVPRLLGDFAFAVWDNQNHELFLARDYFGTRPLVYYTGSNFFAFATSPDALFTNADIPRQVDEASVIRQVVLERQRPERTFFENIRRVPSGNWIKVTHSGVQPPQRYWRLEDTADIRFARDEDYVTAFQELFEEAVRCRLRTIHPIGSHLSSGWDSSSVASVAAMLLAKEERRLRAYTSVPLAGWTPAHPISWQIHDEGPLASLVANQHPNMDHVLIRGPGKWDAAALDKYAQIFSMPRWDINNAGWYDLLHRTARAQGVRVMLTGGAGNLTISYDGSERIGLLLRKGRFLKLAREWICSRARGRSYKSLLRLTFSPLFPAVAWDFILRLLGRRRTNTFARSMLNLDAVDESKIDLGSDGDDLVIANFHRIGRRQRMERFSRGDRAFIFGATLAAWDIDLRDPTIDRRVVEFCYAIPDEQFFFRGQQRRLLRRAMSGLLPQAILDEKRHGRQAADWPEAGAKAKTELLADIERLAQNDVTAKILDIKRMRELTTAWDPAKIVGDERLYDTYLRVQVAITAGRFVRRISGRNE